MSVLIAVIVVAAIGALIIGLGMAMIDVLSLIERRRDDGSPDADSETEGWSYTVSTVALGTVLMVAPPWWCGPSWSYFPQLPHNSFGMGLCLTILSAVQAVALWRRASDRVLAVLFFLNGFVYFVAGGILAAEGLLGHQGLMECPFMMLVGAWAFAHSTTLNTRARGQK